MSIFYKLKFNVTSLKHAQRIRLEIQYHVAESLLNTNIENARPSKTIKTVIFDWCLRMNYYGNIKYVRLVLAIGLSLHASCPGLRFERNRLVVARHCRPVLSSCPRLQGIFKTEYWNRCRLVEWIFNSCVLVIRMTRPKELDIRTLISSSLTRPFEKQLRYQGNCFETVQCSLIQPERDRPNQWQHVCFRAWLFHTMLIERNALITREIF